MRKPYTDTSVKRISAFTRNCIICSKKFVTIPSENKQYCSRKCVGMANSERMKGGVPWLNTPETAKKISITKTGKLSTKKGKHYPHLQGANSSKWRGGVTEPDKLLRSQFRLSHQKLVFERDEYTCQICYSKSGYLQVDHIKKWSDYPELRFDIDNCRTLCMACHYYITFKRKLPEGVVWGHNLSKRIAL